MSARTSSDDAAAAEVEVGGRALRLTSLDKQMWPGAGLTKRWMIDWYRAAAPALLPHLAGRPLTLGRFPSGVAGRGFAQNECRGGPAWLRTAALPLRTGEIRNYCVVDDLASLVWVANQGTVELHPYLARAARPERPDVVVLDLDPGPGTGLLDAARAALRVRDALEALGLAAFAKTTGGAGLHVYVPVAAEHDFEETRAFARGLAARLARVRPDEVTDSGRASQRTGRVRIDWLQNHPRRSTIAAWSLRAVDPPAVSAPVAWEEVVAAVRTGDDTPLVVSPERALERFERAGDPFRGVLELRQRLPG